MPATLARPGRKPRLWQLNPSRVAPEWRWAWNGLVDFVPFWEHAGDPSMHRGLQLVRKNGITWGASSKGVGLRSDAASERAHAASQPRHQIQPPITIAMYCFQLGATPDNDVHFGVSHNNSDTSPFWSYSIGGPGGVDTDKIQMMWNDNGTFEKLNTDTTWDSLAPGFVWVVGKIHKTADQELWVNNVLEATSVTDANPINYGGTSQIEVGSQTSTTGRHANAIILAGYIWSRSVPSVQHKMLFRDPFGPFRMARRPRVNILAAAEPEPTGEVCITFNFNPAGVP